MTIFHRSTVCLAVLLILFAHLVHAQYRPAVEPADVEARMAEQVDTIIAHLELEGELADTVRVILTSRNKELTAMREKMRTNRGQGGGAGNARQMLQAIDEKTSKALAEVLSEQQMKAYTAFIETQRSRGRRGPRQ